jgi:hypothetical protein
MSKTTRSNSALTMGAAVLLLTTPGPSVAATAKPTQAEPAIAATRRLTESQYRHTIADLFGSDIEINGRFEPERRERLLLAIGSSQLSISAAGFEQYFSMGRGIAEQVLNDARRTKFVSCQPVDAKAADDKCAVEFVRKYGRLLFRRPLRDDEVTPRVVLAANGAKQAGNFYSGLKLSLVSLLSAPQFLFRVETLQVDPATKAQRLDGYGKAARLSYLLWDTAPDDELLNAAADGSLHTDAGLSKQLDRLLASPKLEQGARAFFSDMLQLDLFESVTKDAAIYPKFSQAVADAAKEQTLKTVTDLLLKQNGDYRDLFTTRTTYVDRSLASIYQIPFLAGSGWVPHTFAPETEQSGLLTQTTFMVLFSHPGRSSPTKRGVAINEIFQCIPTPTPPANVDFSIVNDTNNPNLKTVRSRLLAHSEDESCAGCHKKSDPLGLSLEHFDSLGQFRLKENGADIDVSSQLDGKAFTGAQGLGKALRDNAKVPPCLVRNVYAYAVGQEPTAAEQSFLDAQTQAFAQDNFRFPTLLRRMASTKDFFKVIAAEAPAAAQSVAQN